MQDKRPQSEKKPSQPRRVTFSLTIPQFLSSLLAIAVGCVWIFLLGVILGRGFIPETHIPELERMMPQGHPGQAARVIAGDAGPQTPEAAPETKPVPPQVIPPEDLAYRDSLKQKPPARSAPQPPKPSPAKQAKPASGQTAPVKTEAQAKTEARSQKQPDKPEAQIFNYVYQVAAYKEAGQSDALAAKLKRSGINARTEKEVSGGVTWYKTLINFKGTPDDTGKLREQLKAHKMERLLLRSKTPAR